MRRQRAAVALEAVGLHNDRQDLASVLRLPSTFNLKGEPRPVVIETPAPWLSFDPDHLTGKLPAASTKRISAASGMVTDDELDEWLAEHGEEHHPDFCDGDIELRFTNSHHPSKYEASISCLTAGS